MENDRALTSGNTSDTPKTDRAQAANIALGHGSMVELPEGYEQCDPWELAREFERRCKRLETVLLDMGKLDY